jgi:beta-lactamase class A
MRQSEAAVERKLDELIAGFSGQVALYVRDLGSGETIARNQDDVFPTASTIKLFILMELIRRVEIGEFGLQQKIPVLACQQVGGSGILKDLSAGIELPLRDVGLLMIVLSDNTATNMLIDLLGLAAINQTIRGLGLSRTTLFNRVDFEAVGDDVTRFAAGTVREFGQALELLTTGAFVSRSACDTIIGIMERQQYLDLLPRYLPYNPYARELHAAQALRIANKTGFFMGIRCDAALLFLPHTTLAAVVFTKDGKDLSFNPDNEGAVLLGRIGEALYGHFSASQPE